VGNAKKLGLAGFN